MLYQILFVNLEFVIESRVFFKNLLSIYILLVLILFRFL